MQEEVSGSMQPVDIEVTEEDRENFKKVKEFWNI